MATKDGFEYRQLHIEDYLLMVSAEQKEQAEVYARRRIASDDDAITDLWTNNLLELIIRRENLNKAYRQVKRNKGSAGIDGMQVDELLPYLIENGDELIRQIREGKYKPNPVRRVEIPKEEKGKVRKLGIPTVVDRMVQQAIAQELTPLYEVQFSDNSYGFRPGRGAHDALKRCRQYADEGYVYVVSMDLASYFDTVNHSKLIEVLSRTVKDGRVISLIHKYLNAGVMEDGGFKSTEEGVPQGGPLSPLLGNVMLHELDKELERRGHKFVRYADDCMIMCKSIKAAERTMRSIVPYITGKLFLKVNLEKTTVAHINKVKYLGYGFYQRKGKCRLRVHPKSVTKMKKRLKELTHRGNRWSNDERKKKLGEKLRKKLARERKKKRLRKQRKKLVRELKKKLEKGTPLNIKLTEVNLESLRSQYSGTAYITELQRLDQLLKEDTKAVSEASQELKAEKALYKQMAEHVKKGSSSMKMASFPSGVRRHSGRASNAFRRANASHQSFGADVDSSPYSSRAA